MSGFSFGSAWLMRSRMDLKECSKPCAFTTCCTMGRQRSSGCEKRLTVPVGDGFALSGGSVAGSAADAEKATHAMAQTAIAAAKTMTNDLDILPFFWR